MAKTFTLWVTVLRFIDGDTFLGVIDQGFNTHLGVESKPVRCRCALINAPELPTPEGQAALEFARTIAPPGDYQCISYKPDEYGRPLVDLALPSNLFSLTMIAAGHAVRYS